MEKLRDFAIDFSIMIGVFGALIVLGLLLNLEYQSFYMFYLVIATAVMIYCSGRRTCKR